MKVLLTSAAAAGALLLTAGAASAQMSDAQLKAKIEAQGYTSVRITEHDKDHVDVTAMKGGKKVKLAADPKTGQVKPDADKDDDDAKKR